ncbi:hypothetical protein BGZ58_007228, partial [Dissophora ornata]
MSENPKPVVMIVGGGLGGLMLGILLEKINVPYHIFERASEVKPLGKYIDSKSRRLEKKVRYTYELSRVIMAGSAMALSVNIMPVFEQLGLLDEIYKFSVSSNYATIYDQHLNVIGTSGMRNQKEICGYDKVIFARPNLHKLMLDQIPPEKVFYGKRVLRTEEKDDKVLIHCSDNSTYAGDILVGADGAYSSIRQSLYKRLDDQGILPKSDLENLALGYNCMVGVTDPLDPEKYKELKDDFAHFTAILGNDRYS